MFTYLLYVYLLLFSDVYFVFCNNCLFILVSYVILCYVMLCKLEVNKKLLIFVKLILPARRCASAVYIG